MDRDATAALGNVIKGIAANQGSIKSIEKHNELVKNALKRFSNIEQLQRVQQLVADYLNLVIFGQKKERQSKTEKYDVFR